MASDADICNLALGHVGDDTVVTSVDPPDSSAAAGYCARFLPLARRTMLEGGAGGFALRRAALAQIDNDSTQWAFKYALPAGIIKPLKILDHSYAASTLGGYGAALASRSIFNEQGSELFDRQGGALYTNVPEAMLLYVVDVTDTTVFTPTFTTALTYMLGAFLAGPIVRGSAGVQLGQALRQVAMDMAANAAVLDANASAQNDASDFVPGSIRARGAGSGYYNTVRY